tara:strand:- start:394 stop:762 length:369 start_codon:yes stop_codon:yes gene_type:complete
MDNNEYDEARRLHEKLSAEAFKLAITEEITDERRAQMKEEEDALFACEIPARFSADRGYKTASQVVNIKSESIMTVAEAQQVLDESQNLQDININGHQRHDGAAYDKLLADHETKFRQKRNQ